MPPSRKSSWSWGHTGALSLGTNLSASSVLTTVLTYTEETRAGATTSERTSASPVLPGARGRKEQVLHRGPGGMGSGGREGGRAEVLSVDRCWPHSPATSTRPQAPPLSNFNCADDLARFHMSTHAINIKSYLLQRGHRFVHLYPYT